MSLFKKQRFAVVLVALNLLCCLAFLALRPPDPPGGRLDEFENIRNTGEINISTADPWGWVAERPLYNWSEWHGGESVWVKCLILANLPAVLVTTTLLDSPDQFSPNPTRTQTWLAGAVFLVLSTIQWWLVGYLISRVASRALTTR